MRPLLCPPTGLHGGTICYDFVVLTHTKNQVSAPLKLAKLGIADLDAAYALECVAFPEPMQASHQTLTTRFKLDHFMFGAWEGDQLVGMASWRRGWFDPDNKSIFPKSFKEYSNASHSNPHNAAFVYNLCINPAKRGRTLARILIKSVINEAKSDKCRYLVGGGRCPSYNGDEQILPNSILRNSINNKLSMGQSPSLSEYLSDPLLCFYHRILGCEFLWTMPGYLPSDSASGGHQVIFYKVLNEET